MKAEPTPPPASAGVSAEQPPSDGLAELKALETELSTKPGPGAKPGGGGEGKAPDAAADAREPEGGAPRRRRKFKRPPPENTIRMTIRQYWRFRAWVANRKLQLPPEMFAAVLDGTDQTLVEPLVEPVIGIMDEYIPEEWITFIEDKSPILTFIIALFEAEQTFGARIAQLAAEIRNNRPPARSAEAPPGGGSGYPRKGE